MDKILIENCAFSDPYYFSLSEKKLLPMDDDAGSSWNYSQSTCTTTDQGSDLIQATTGEFYLDKSVSYGDFLLIFFLFLFTAFFIFNFILKFIFKQKVSFRNQ